jgi:hypothetical protein
MRALWTMAIVIVLQAALLGGAVGAAFYERHEHQFACGKPVLVATVVGYNLWKVRDCGADGHSVYMITPPIPGESLPSADRQRAI